MLAAIRSNAKEFDGVLMYPSNFGEYSGQAGSIVPVPRDQAQWYQLHQPVFGDDALPMAGFEFTASVHLACLSGCAREQV